MGPFLYVDAFSHASLKRGKYRFLHGAATVQQTVARDGGNENGFTFQPNKPIEAISEALSEGLREGLSV
jgi:hypothetical protein